MTFAQLVRRGLWHYWRTNLAVVGGVATAVAVLAGALLVGDSVRGSLRELVLQRLGSTDQATLSPRYFRTSLATELGRDPRVAASPGQDQPMVVPLVAVSGVATEQASSRRVGDIRVYGVDDRFWAFHNRRGIEAPAAGDAFLSAALARDLGATEGSAVLVRVQRPSDMPLESLHGRKDDLGRTSRVIVRRVLGAADLGDFAIEPGQGDVRAVFIALAALQRALEVDDRVNTLLFGPAASAPFDLTARVRQGAQLEDVGLSVRALEGPRAVSIGSDAGLIDDPTAAATTQALRDAGYDAQPVFTYLANTIRVGEREIPYSLVSAIDLDSVAPSRAAPSATPPSIVLNRWAADELRASSGDRLTLEYLVWEDPGQLATRTADFHVAAIVPIEAGDRDLAPSYPGISDSPTVSDWDPPFPVELRRIRPADEDYWERYRTTPKAFIPLDVGRQLWGSRYGRITSIRVPFEPGETPAAARDRVLKVVRPVVDQLAQTLAPRSVRAEALAASRGATNFGEYFVYFSFFIVVSALLLTALFFKLGIEQRVREIGLLRAVGFGPTAVRRLFLAEGAALATVGSVLGIGGAIGYAAALMHGLRSWWVDAVGTTALALHVTPVSLLGGAVGGLIATLGCIWWTLRALAHVSDRSLLAGEVSARMPDGAEPSTRSWLAGAGVFAMLGLTLIAAGLAGLLAGAGAFFAAGSALLVASLLAFAALVRRAPRAVLAGRGWAAVSRLGMRGTSYRPGRAVLSVAVMASATFILIAVDAFRRDGSIDATNPRSGTGGYPLLVETLLPVVEDPNSRRGRNTLNLFDLDPSVTLEPLRLLPGDDASCLNLYEPRSPRILAPRDSFRAQARFTFQRSLATTDGERQNPWLLLDRVEPDGAVPVIADANSMTYVLHRALGEDLVISREGRDIRLRLVAALSDSVLQRELLMSEANFIRLFPHVDGYRVMLVDIGSTSIEQVQSTLESALTDFGADAVKSAERLAEFHKVENTYLSTFQALGGLGLLLGTLGLGTVLLRNVLERRRELALLAAVGYERRHFTTMVLAENLLLLVTGLAVGTVCAALAIAPALVERGGRLPVSRAGGVLLATMLVVGASSAWVAVVAAARTRLVDALRSE